MGEADIKWISVAEFEAWLSTATATARIPYVTGLRIPRGCQVATAARQAADAGLVYLVQDRRTGPRRYLAERTSKPVPALVAARVAQRSARRADPGDEDASALSDLIDRITRAGGRFPSNAQLAELLDLPEWRAARALRRLKDRGDIAVAFHPTGWALARVVTVKSTGRSSAAPPPLICPLVASSHGRAMEMAA